ncbi:MAG: hypothetical protein JWN85_4799 [Gammaproteobacteria bacterium]|nr:hypothetical protein [Gammaproteobacteria bacterium]
MFKIASVRSLWVLLIATAAACSDQRQPAPAAPVPPQPRAAAQSAWTEYAGRFIEDYFKAHPFFAVQSGRHEFDGQMTDLSAAGIAKNVEQLKKARAEAVAFDAAALTPDQSFEREYVLSVIDRELFWLDRARAPFTNPAWYIDQIDPEVYLSRDYAPLEKRLKGYVGYAHAIPQIAADVRANLHVPLPKSLVERGIAGFGGYAQFYRNDVARVFASVQDPAAQKELADADATAAKAMDDLKAWLVSQRENATDAFALGEPLFTEMLKATEQVDVPIADLAAIGRADLDRNTQALKEACAQFLPKGTLRACVDKMNAHKPKGGPVEGARAQLADLRAFIVAKHIVTIPSNEQALVAEAPPYMRGNFAYINIPGPYDKGVASTYNISPPDPSWSAKERAAYIPGEADLLYTSVHEVWPGHFQQFLHANRNPSKIAALWVGYAYAEGWAHYCEEMMWEEGLGNGDAEQHIGQLANALLRDVRFLSAIGLHTQGMTLAQAENLFRDSAFSDPGNARQQAARGTYDPAYLNYTLGKLMIRKLRADWVARQTGATAGETGAAPAGTNTGVGGAGAGDPKNSWQAFHDKFLSYGGPPIPLVRKVMLGEAGSLF